MPYVFVMSLDPHARRSHLLMTDKWPTAIFVPICVEFNQCVGCTRQFSLVKLVKDMSVMQFADRASFRVVARSVDGDGEEGDPK